MENPTTAVTYDKWFYYVDKDQDGRLNGADAVEFFQRSGLPRDILSKVWALSDSKKEGFLGRHAFRKVQFAKHEAMELISMAQQGKEISHEDHVEALREGIVEANIEGMASITAQLPSQIAANKSSYSLATAPSKSGRKSKHLPASVCTSVTDGLKKIYFEKVRPLEEAFRFGSFFAPLLNMSDFEARPSVLLLGQYSTGKTTFIKYLLGRDYPGAHIGPEPTTDRFVVCTQGYEERRIPGNTLVVQPDRPYQGLQIFGTSFLGRFEASQCPSKLLEEITLVDTPGVLSGEKQRVERQYDFIGVCEWFASRCDLILLLFDPYKLDISDEFKKVINALKGHDEKIRVVLNKGDQVSQQQLMRVYGALMWSLGKVFRSPEVCRVYIGSFNAQHEIVTDKNPHAKELFEAEQQDLLNDLHEIPQRSCDRKVNEFVKRVRAAKIHILVIGHLRKQLPSMFGKKSAYNKVLDNMDEHFDCVRREYHLPAGDFPDVDRFRKILFTFDLSSFPKVDKKMVKVLDDVLTADIPALIRQFHNPYE